MLVLQCKLSGTPYGIPVEWIQEVIPDVNLEPQPGTTGNVAGLLNYRGQIVPVIDLSYLLHGVAVERRLSTRIIVVQASGAGSAQSFLVGLRAEAVTETCQLNEAMLQSQGIRMTELPALCEVALHNGELLQMIQPRRLLTETLATELLFSESAADGLL